ncbi:hypothetical protein GRI39_11635 [Altererythrobacter indicus]|uniref:Tetratricopeptide repeat protein n=1 Tax=Altericroceibacterium indicum TaxID=374177 RepID=A0A845AHU9_9SPHN|nr:putative 2OG-Fe(II) oxygenase [Altericroceibacterium indicum]MXP26688.1 hypothetical protein [Altericroceibacterium indicum]
METSLPLESDDWRALLSEGRDRKARGDTEAALALYHKAAALAPQEALPAHSLAALLGDLSRFSEAEDWAAKAVTKGGKAPESLLVLGRAQQGNARFDAAERSFEQAITARPDYFDAHHDLAQLRWMRTNDVAAASSALERQISAEPANAKLLELKARILLSADKVDDAGHFIQQAIIAAPDQPALHIFHSHIAARQKRPEAQLAAATQALQLNRSSQEAAKAALEALLHCGRAEEAEQLAIRILQAHPGDQGIVALLTTAWRIMGDTRYETFCTSPGLISAQMMDAPASAHDLPSYLADLKTALLKRHPWKSHPLDQSLRHGSQTQEDLTQSSDPVIATLFQGLKPLIAQHIAQLGTGPDPVRMRSNGRFRLGPAWSVALSPGGFHTDHVHPQGWMSCAFYVDLPQTIQQGREGWLAFGRPGIPTQPSLQPFQHIKPEPGMLAIFPSYMWHGTEVFSGDQKRLTVAFDILPGL